ncbi:MAG: hypothetical protein KGD67_09525 [Candidatus Lokiarchaeota archaeon]|nr:hypothetical protein [Candidatus Lokiarchaeota archaeon]
MSLTLIGCLVVFGVQSTFSSTGMGLTTPDGDLKASSEQDLVNKVFTFLSPNDTLRFENLHLVERVTYYVLLEIVTPHNCEINVSIIDPVMDVYNVFETEVNISQDDDWFEIPFGTAIAGNYTFIISIACALNLNLHIKISFDSEVKCLYDMIAPKFLEHLKLYQVNKFYNGMVVEHNTVLKTDESYKFYLGRVNAIGGLTVANEVRVNYHVTDPDGIEFNIYQNETIGNVGTLMHFDFGTAMEGIYTIKIRILCQVEVVNIAYAISEDYQISTINNGTTPKPEPQANETVRGYFYVPIEWTLVFGISAGGFVVILTVLVAVRRKRDSVSLQAN